MTLTTRRRGGGGEGGGEGVVAKEAGEGGGGEGGGDGGDGDEGGYKPHRVTSSFFTHLPPSEYSSYLQTFHQ